MCEPDKEGGWDVGSEWSGLHLKSSLPEEWLGYMMEARGHGEVTQAYTVSLFKTRNVWRRHARQMFKCQVYRNQNVVNTALSSFSGDLWAHAGLAVSVP